MLTSKFDAKQLLNLGIDFVDSMDKELFLKMLNDEFEVRVGQSISKDVPIAKLEEMDCLLPDEARSWFDENGIDPNKYVSREKRGMKSELLRYRDHIVGIKKDELLRKLGYKTQDLELSVRSQNLLMKAGLYSVGEIVAYGDLSTIRNMSARSVQEIECRIDKILGVNP